MCTGVCMYIYGEKNFTSKNSNACIRQIVLGAQLAAIYVDVHSGIKSEKNIATYHEVFFKGACEVIIFFFF